MRYALPLLFLLGCGSERGVEVTREAYGDSWPFTVEAGHADCVDGQLAIFRHEGREYALTSLAESRGIAPIEPIWRDNPDFGGPKINLGPMTRLALEQCE